MKSSALKVKTGIKGGRIAMNHNRGGLKVKAGIKGGKIAMNHNRPSLVIS